MLHKTLFDDGEHQWIVFARDPNKPDSVIDTNEYMVINSDRALLLDPGGTEIFPTVLSEVSRKIDVEKIQAYFCSHQDPDIMSSLPLWMALTPNANIYVSWLWSKFVSHFGNAYVDRFIEIPDPGMKIAIGTQQLEVIPAHFCHSAGNFSVYDPRAKILWSGDIGSALLPAEAPLIVEDFDRHIGFMEGFHTRWMPSNEAKNRWVRRVRKLDIDMICPQHGAIFTKPHVGSFLDWFEGLEVGKTKG